MAFPRLFGRHSERYLALVAARRYRYNRDLLVIGIVTSLLVLFAGSAAVTPGEDFVEPIAMIFGPFIYGLFANLAYTAGLSST